MIRLLFLVMVTLTTALMAVPEDSYGEEMMLAREYYDNGTFGMFEGVGGVKISYACFPVQNEKGRILFLTGKSESHTKYDEFVYDMRNSGYSIYMMDHRGMGYSQRLVDNSDKVFVGRFEDYVSDAKKFYDQVVSSNYDGKIFLMSHSMGGAVSALYLETHPDDFDAAVLSAPMLKVDTGKYPEWLTLLVTGSATFFGQGEKYAAGQGDRPSNGYPFEGNRVTHSFPRHRHWEADMMANPGMVSVFGNHIRTGGATNRWLKESIEATKKIRKNANKINTPLLIFQAELDTFVKPEGQNEVSEKASDCTLLFFEGSKHEILMESDPIRERAIEEALSFFEAN